MATTGLLGRGSGARGMPWGGASGETIGEGQGFLRIRSISRLQLEFNRGWPVNRVPEVIPFVHDFAPIVYKTVYTCLVYKKAKKKAIRNLLLRMALSSRGDWN